MREGELETAICKAFPLLLPDLYDEGYRIRSSQAILLLRRIDLLLETPDGRACIIELKAGAPPMPHVRDQILDYAECWRVSYPKSAALRLIVIANDIPAKTQSELANFGVESRAISEASALDALERCQTDESVLAGLKLLPDDLSKVRHLLSDYGAVTVPDGMVLAAPWNHEKVFLALVKRGESHKDLWKKNIYVRLYRQHPKLAVLYGPNAGPFRRAPLHVKPTAPDWNETAFQRMSPSIEFVQSDNKGPGRERQNCDWYRVKDWDGLAASLGLDCVRVPAQTDTASTRHPPQ